MRLLFVFGTRPEAIKLAPVIRKFGGKSGVSVGICSTGQHKEMLKQVLDFFSMVPDFELDVMKPDQTLFDVTARILNGMEGILRRYNPDLVFVQGDTTTAFVAALAAFYERVKIAHVEAGLRSYNRHAPFPEEINRRLVAPLADIHFAPTQKAADNLKKENIKENVYVVGNTVIDALYLALELLKDREGEMRQRFGFLDFSKKVILVTAHRRESFGEPFRNICEAIREMASFRDIEIVYPVHLNPNVRKPVMELLSDVRNVHLIEPLNYHELVWLMNRAYFVMTDSGGIQEEAPSLRKPVLVMRDVTERVEGIEANTARLVGTDRESIVKNALALIDNPELYSSMANAVNPYGDGKASERILRITLRLLDYSPC